MVVTVVNNNLDWLFKEAKEMDIQREREKGGGAWMMNLIMIVIMCLVARIA